MIVLPVALRVGESAGVGCPVRKLLQEWRGEMKVD